MPFFLCLTSPLGGFDHPFTVAFSGKICGTWISFVNRWRVTCRVVGFVSDVYFYITRRCILSSKIVDRVKLLIYTGICETGSNCNKLRFESVHLKCFHKLEVFRGIIW